MSVTYRAILPKNSAWAKAGEKALNNLLLEFAVAAERKLRTYPPAQPWKNPPRTGLRAGGKRTGNYGRGWQGDHQLKSGESITLTNPVKYATFVGGPQQAGFMKQRGWPNIKEVGEEAAKEAIQKWKFDA